MKKISLLLLFVFSAAMFAQNMNDKAKLQEFAKVMEKEAKVQKQYADSVASANNFPIKKVMPNGKMMELQKIDNGIPVYYETDNMNSARTISTNLVWPGSGLFNLTGKDQKIGVWDGGPPRTTHQEFGGRITIKDGSTSTAQHATHVCGTIIAAGINPNAHGMADSAIIDAYDWTNDLGEISLAASNGLTVSSHSYGNVTGWTYDYRSDGKWAWLGDTTKSEVEDYKFGFYSGTTYNWDLFANQAPYTLVCRSAGNDREDTGPGAGVQHWVIVNGSWKLSTKTRNKDGNSLGFDCMHDASLGKNVLSVGAVNDIYNGYKKPSDVVMSTFSSWGPTDDGRIKPDVVANGVDLTSCDYISDNSYVTMSGTSMATPSTSGSIALLLSLQKQLYNTTLRSSTVKGLVIHTADEAGANPGPDYSFGWGLVNTFKAALLMKLNYQLPNHPLISENVLNQGNTIEIPIQTIGNEPLKATICWIDPPGTVLSASLNPRDIMLKNDVDLRIIGPTGTVYYPWVLDVLNPSAPATTGDNIRDNVEQVFISNPVPGNYNIQITHKGTLVNGSQNVSLIMSGIVSTAPEQVNLVSPVNGSQGVSTLGADFTWNETNKAMSYQLQISTDSTFATVNIEQDSIYLAKVNISSLEGQKKYFWRVRGYNGGFGSWSNVWNFYTSLGMPTTPVQIYPAANSTRIPTPVVFKWNAAQNAANYKLQVSGNTIFTQLVVNDSTITDTTFTSNNVLDGKVYYWRIGSKNATGNSAFSVSNKFQTKLNTPDSLKATFTMPKTVGLTWNDKSANETNYFIMKKAGNGAYAVIDSIAANSTAYNDTTVQLGNKYYYKVYAKNAIGVSDTSAEVIMDITDVKEDNYVVSSYELFQNYPNPFNPSTMLKYSLPEAANVTLTIYNSLGEKVATLVKGVKTAGVHTIEWNASKYNSGVYFYELKTDKFRSVKKLLFLK